jgi:acetyltransferase-like isoleucine patch superfamily enzyme
VRAGWFVRLINGGIDALGALVGHAVRKAMEAGWVYFPFVSEALSTIPFSLGWKVRRAVYARVLPRMGRSAVLHFGVTIEDPRTTIGDDVWISVGCYLDYVDVADSVLIGPHVVFLAGGRHHRFDRLDVPIKHQGNPEKTALLIGRGAWIGANATILAEVGHDAIVGAGAVVTRAVPPYAIVAGNPARVLRMRQATEQPPDLSLTAQGTPDLGA